MYWNDQLAQHLAERLLIILQQGQSDATYTPRLRFAIQTILKKHACLESKHSPAMWPLVQQLYGRITDADAKMEIHKAILVFAAECAAPAQRAEARAFALQNWQSFSDSSLRSTFAYLATLNDAASQDLQRALIQQEFTLAQNEIQNPSERTMQRLALGYENRNFIATQAIESVLLKSMESSDNAFTLWRPVIADYCKKLEAEFVQQVAERCLNLVAGSYSQPRRQGFYELFVTALPLLNADTKARLLPTYFTLCKHTDLNLRGPAAAVLVNVKNAVDEQDFKLGLNTLVRDICRMAPSEVAGYRQILDATMVHSALFTDYEWRDLADLSKRSIQQADGNLQDYGLTLIERMPAIPAEHEGDLVHLLLGIARGSNPSQKEKADKILRKLPEGDLGARIRGALHDYLFPADKVENAERS